MSEKTAGQAACEAFRRTPVTMCGCTQVPELPPCEHQMIAWEAAAQAGNGRLTGRIDELLGDVNRLTAERDRYADDFHFERKQVVALRQVVTEMITCAKAKDPSLFDDDQIAEWCERARLDAARATTEPRKD